MSNIASGTRKDNTRHGRRCRRKEGTARRVPIQGGSRLHSRRLSGTRKGISGKDMDKSKFNLGLDREIKRYSCLKISN